MRDHLSTATVVAWDLPRHNELDRHGERLTDVGVVEGLEPHAIRLGDEVAVLELEPLGMIVLGRLIRAVGSPT